MDVTIFGINLTLNPVAFTLPIGDGWPVHWYGIIIATGFMLAVIYGMLNGKRLGVDTDRLIDVVIVATPVAILCARLYYILFDDSLTLADFFDFSNGGFSGLAIYGGVIGAFLSGGIMCYVRKVRVLSAFDLAAVGFLIGQGIGRWGNFINQEAFGVATGCDWSGMTSVNVEKVLGKGARAHPCFLYESIWCLTGALLLHIYSKKRSFEGQIILGYCVWYGAGRMFIEQLRTDSLFLGGPFRISTLVSIVLFVGGIAATVYFKKKVSAKTEEYAPVFADAMDDEPIAESEEE